MSESRKLSVPADNPEYFNLADWEGIDGNGTSQAETNQAILNNLGDLQPTNEFFASLVTIEKLAEKEKSSKIKKNKLGSSLKRLFSSNSRRGSGTGLENEYLPTPASPSDTKVFGSLPSTPTKTPLNPFFRHSGSESRSLKPLATKQLSQPVTPTTPDRGCIPISRWYYNVDQNKSPSDSKPARTPVKNTKPPPCPTKTNTPKKSSFNSTLKTNGKSQGRSRSKSNCSTGTGRDGVVPGMEAPPLPVLHSVCRGFAVGEMPKIVVLYSGGCNLSRQWRDYLCKMLEMREENDKVFGQRVEEFSETSSFPMKEEGRRCEEVVYHSDLVLVIISQKLISWLDKTGIVLGKILNPNRVVGLLMGVTHTDITPNTTNCLVHFPSWRLVEIKEGGGEESDFLIGQYCQEISEAHEVNTALPEEPKFKVFPRKISQGQNKVQIIMDNFVDQSDREQFELLICLDDRHFSVEDAKWIKDDLVQVEVPASLFKSTLIATLVLKLNGKNFGSRQLKLENASAILESAWQICTDPVSILSDAFDVRFVNDQDIDEFLSASLEKKLSISDLLSTRYKGESKEDTFIRDHSNLLHFAAKHGFTRVCQTLLSLGYQKYLTVPNILGLNPAECAEKSGYHSLAQELRGHMPPLHDYQYPQYEGGGCLEGEDGYLLPSQAVKVNTTPDGSVSDPELDYQNVCHDYQVPTTPVMSRPNASDIHTPKLVPIFENLSESSSKPVSPVDACEDSSNFYQVPPAPVPVILAPPISIVSPSSGSSSNSISSTPPNQSRLSGGSYLPMVPPLKKALSEPRPTRTFSIPKSSSFSHFSPSYSDKILPQSSNHTKTAMSRDELIQKFCKEEIPVRPGSTPPNLVLEDLDSPSSVGTPTSSKTPPRPDSTPPDINYYQNQYTVISPSIGIPSRSSSFSSSAGKIHRQPEQERGTEGSPFDHHVHTDPNIDGLVYLPIESHDSDSELTSYYEAGKISEQSLISYRKNSAGHDVEATGVVKNRHNSLGDGTGEVGKVKKMLGRLSPARSKLGFNMGSLRRKTGTRISPRCDDNDNIIDNSENSDLGIFNEGLKDSILSLNSPRSSSLKNVATPLPPKVSINSKTLPSPDKKTKPSVSSSLYDIPRHLSNNNTSDYIMAENNTIVAQIGPCSGTVASQIVGAKSHSLSKPVKNSNTGAYENVKIIHVEKV